MPGLCLPFCLPLCLPICQGQCEITPPNRGNYFEWKVLFSSWGTDQVKTGLKQTYGVL